MTGIDTIYRHRFSADERRVKDAVWKVLCEGYFQRFIRAEHDVVLDVGCGLGEFSRHIRARRKLAIDANPAVQALMPPDVEFHAARAEGMPAIADGSVDVCFSSNFLEHLPSKDAVDALLAEIGRVLRPGGIYVALQPNIRFCARTYWDFYDHHVALSDRSCAEAFVKAGLAVEQLIPQFLPYTTKSALPKAAWLIRTYLRVPILWRLFGAQFLIVGRKPPASAVPDQVRSVVGSGGLV